VAGRALTSPTAGGEDGEVRRCPKGVDDGGVVELTKGGADNGATTRRRHGGGSLVGRCGHEVEEKRGGGDGLLERALAREDERGRKRGGTAVTGCPL
jgi:hypothetical protein